MSDTYELNESKNLIIAENGLSSDEVINLVNTLPILKFKSIFKESLVAERNTDVCYHIDLEVGECMIFNPWDTELTRSSTIDCGYTFKRGYALLLGNRAYLVLNIGSGGGYYINASNTSTDPFTDNTQDIVLYDYRDSSSTYYLTVDPYVRTLPKNVSSYTITVLNKITVGVIRIA